MNVAPPSDNLIPCSTRLSPRQAQIACMVADGVGRKIIASRLGISLKTVDNHITDICNKIEGEARPIVRITRFVLTQGSTGQLAA